MRTKKTGKILLRDALIEAMLREFDRDMEKCEESPICSPEHYKKMSEIVGFDVTKPRRNPRMSVRKKVIIFIIAAALALTGCVAVFYRQIGNFMEKFYKDHIEVWFDNEEANEPPQEIEDVYTLTYVPEGFELVEQKENKIAVIYIFSKENGETFIFNQFLIENLNQMLDIEEGYTYIMIKDNLSIYFKNINNVNLYKWNNKQYAFSICTRCTLSEFEIKKIIDGLTLK